jgi:kynureninase
VDDAQARDAHDPLAGFRDQFVIGDPELAYLDGNSLGRLPKATAERIRRDIQAWGEDLIRGWDRGWMELPVTVGDLLGSAALGAGPGQVVVGDSTTVCFYKLAAAALDARPGRRRIIANADDFPTDRYVLESLATARDLEVVWLRFDPDAGPDASSIASALDDQTALVAVSHVAYRSAHIADMPAINQLAHAAGALTLWDLSHSAGALALALDADDCDLAVGCTYKYLNGGPGAPAYMYVRHEVQADIRQPIWGWLGRRDPFSMGPGYLPAEGPVALLSGTPPVLALGCVQEGVRLVAQAGIAAIREKGIRLTQYAIELIDRYLAPLGAAVGSPRDPLRRGAHVALRHPDAAALTVALRQRQVITDFREPDVVRLGLSPLTTRYIDVWRGIDALRETLSENVDQR